MTESRYVSPSKNFAFSVILIESMFVGAHRFDAGKTLILRKRSACLPNTPVNLPFYKNDGFKAGG